MSENINVTDPENQGNNLRADERQDIGKKTFTQEEVNIFVQSRIARLKGQIEKELKAEYERKLAELNAREMKLLAREKLAAKGLNVELADIISCTDEKDLTEKIEKLEKIYGGSKATAASEEKKDAPLVFGGFQLTEVEKEKPVDRIRQAMGLSE